MKCGVTVCISKCITTRPGETDGYIWSSYHINTLLWSRPAAFSLLHVSTHLFPEARAQRVLFCGRSLLAAACVRSNTIVIVSNKHKYSIAHLLFHSG